MHFRVGLLLLQRAAGTTAPWIASLRATLALACVQVCPEAIRGIVTGIVREVRAATYGPMFIMTSLLRESLKMALPPDAHEVRRQLSVRRWCHLACSSDD